MAISWDAAVALANKIVTDVPAIKTMLDAVAKMDFTALTNLPENAKRMASVTGGMQLQKFVSGAWSTVGKLMHDVDTVDGKHAATGTNADTIPVRDASGAIPGDITGNAVTATSAQALSQVNPIAKGGTGASTAAQARKNLGIVTATTSGQGLVRPDGQTVRGDAAGTLTVQDVAISGNTADLASGRGQIGGCPAVTASANLNDYTRQGNWFFFNAAVGENFPTTIGGWLTVYERSGYIYQVYRVINSDRAWGRRRASTETWTAWASFVASTLIGDGITVNNGIISVPEYQGATASTPGTSGLVPPAAAREQGHALTGGGEYKLFAPDGFGLGVDSTYDLVSDLNAAIKNGWYTTVPTTANIPEPNAYGVCLVSCCDDNTIYQLHFGANVWIRTISHRQQIYGTWRTICNVATGDARYAALARSAERLRNAQGGEMIFSWQGQGGQPAWLWGGNEGGTMYVWSPASLNVGYANNAGYAAKTTGLTYTFTKNSSLVLPAGGTWFVLKWWDGDGGTASGNWSSGQLVAGGTTVNVNNGAFALRVA